MSTHLEISSVLRVAICSWDSGRLKNGQPAEGRMLRGNACTSLDSLTKLSPEDGDDRLGAKVLFCGITWWGGGRSAFAVWSWMAMSREFLWPDFIQDLLLDGLNTRKSATGIPGL